MQDKDIFIKEYEDHVMWKEYRDKGKQLDIRGERIFDVSEPELVMDLSGALYGDTEFDNIVLNRLDCSDKVVTPYSLEFNNCTITTMSFENMIIPTLVINNSKLNRLRLSCCHIRNLITDNTDITHLTVDDSYIEWGGTCASIQDLTLSKSILDIDSNMTAILDSLRRNFHSQILNYHSPNRLITIESGAYGSFLYDAQTDRYWKRKWYTSPELMEASRNGTLDNFSIREGLPYNTPTMLLQLVIEMGMNLKQFHDVEEVIEESIPNVSALANPPVIGII